MEARALHMPDMLEELYHTDIRITPAQRALMILLVGFLFLYFKASYNLTEDYLEFPILLPLLLSARIIGMHNAPPQPPFAAGMQPSASYMFGKHFTN